MVHHQMKPTTKKNKKKPKLIFICLIKAPFTLLAVVRDLYVRGITNCSGQSRYESAPRFNRPPKSPTLTSSRLTTTKSCNEDFRELVRAASARTLAEGNINGRKLTAKFVIGIETIDEEKPCEFGHTEVRVCARVSRLRY